MLTSTTVASNKQTSEDQAGHNRLLFNMTVWSVQQIRRQPEWNPENKTAKATQPNLACTYISVVFTLPALLQPLCTQFGLTVAFAFVTLLACSCKLLHCGVPGCSDCSSAVVLEMHACVGRDQHLCCLLFPGGINMYVLLFLHKIKFWARWKEILLAQENRYICTSGHAL